MNPSRLLPIAIAAVLAAGCAPMDQKPAEPQPERDYVTGSRLPARDGSSSANVSAVENRQGIEKMVRPIGAGGPPPGMK
jgi:hypothetical protein